MPSPLDNSSIAPFYIQIVGSIRYDIDSGKLREGDKLPSEAEMCRYYHVSRITVRRALDELKKAGYLEKKQGKGTFVKSVRDLVLVQEHADIDVASFTDSCHKAGFQPGSIEVGLDRVMPSPQERAFFGLAEGEQVLRQRRVRTADGTRIMYEVNRFPLAYAFLEGEDLTDVSLYTALEARGIVPHMVGECRLTSARATGEVAENLQVPHGEPLFVLDASYRDQHDDPLYVGTEIIVGARYSFAL